MVKNHGIRSDGGRRIFACILIAQFCSLLGQEVLQFVLPLYLLDATGSGTRFGLAIAFGFVPYTVLSPIGGVLADRTRKRGIMMGVNAALVVVLAVFLGVHRLLDPFVAVVLATVASFIAQALYQPAIQSTVPFVLEDADVSRGVALVSQIGSLTTLGGPVVGAAVYGFAGLEVVVLTAIVTFALSGAIVALFVHIPCEPAPWGGGVWSTVRGDLAKAVRYLRTKPVLLGGMASGTIVNLTAGAMVSVGTVYVVTKTLGLTAMDASFAQVALGAGSLIGPSLLVIAPGVFTFERSAWYEVAIALAMGIVAWALSPVASLDALFAFAIMLAGYALCTMAGGLMGSCMMASLQQGAPIEMVGKIVALYMTLLNCATPLGQAAYGVIYDMLPAWGVALSTALILGVTAAVWSAFLQRHRVRV